MKLTLINADDENYAKEILERYYRDDLIPKEKKNYLTDLRHSHGPYLGIESRDGSTHYLLDAASQIATLAHGFNSPILFNAIQMSESWTNHQTDQEYRHKKNIMRNFLARKLNIKNAGDDLPLDAITYTHSGAESNEVALGILYRYREHPEANRVLAFEGSFHGRMMLSLFSTWNKSKREPFEWQKHLSQYVPYPEKDDAEINIEMSPAFKKAFCDLWRKSSEIQFSYTLNVDEEAKKLGNIDQLKANEIELLKKELHSLKLVCEHLKTKQIFAIIVEPMQCEGGEAYSSNRFHLGLLMLARTFNVPVIMDEVQTGFHLGRSFFWHRQWDLTDDLGNEWRPDFISCAKKAQIGISINLNYKKFPGQLRLKSQEEFSVASLARGYAQAISIDQMSDKILLIEKELRLRVDKLLHLFSDHLLRPRCLGLAFGFDLKNKDFVNKLVDKRFKFGLLFYPAGDKTLRFRANTSFTKQDFDFLFQSLELLIKEVVLNTPQTPITHVELAPTENEKHLSYEWSELFIKSKLTPVDSISYTQTMKDTLSLFAKQHPSKKGFKLFEINAQNFLKYREEIIDLEKTVYEEARQTDIEKFEHTILNPASLALGIISQEKLVGIAFAGPLSTYPLERGIRNDSQYANPQALYMLDLTIAPKFQKEGLGRSLKYALTILAHAKNIHFIQGRNRDRLAKSMIGINLSLGAWEEQYLKDDYPDFEKYRDVFYYTTAIHWKNKNLFLSNGLTSHYTEDELNLPLIKTLMPSLVNKVCLSNFVSQNFLEVIKEIYSALPVDLAHGYTTSGQSECTDKIIKSLWSTLTGPKKENQITKILTFNGHYFGEGSMLSRSLSHIKQTSPYFEVQAVEHPNEHNEMNILMQIESELKTQSYLAVMIEPVAQLSMKKVSLNFLTKLRNLCTQYQTTLIYNESASQFFRYGHGTFFASEISSIKPDMGFLYLGGQAGLCFMKKEHYLPSPLMMISTWDGDEFSFFNYASVFRNVIKNNSEHIKLMSDFGSKLKSDLMALGIDDRYVGGNGTGFFSGTIPLKWQNAFFKNADKEYIVCPNIGSMKRYLREGIL